MSLVHFITHPEVVIDPAVPVPDWPLSGLGVARMQAMLSEPWVSGVGAVFSSTERKARQGARILAGHLGQVVTELAALGENDRTATGYLPKAEFERVADAFFARPGESVRGWERAVDAQARIVGAVAEVLRRAPEGQDVSIVAHGGVGALLLCHLTGQAISRAADQPGGGGGNRFVFRRDGWAPVEGWQPIGARLSFAG